MQCKYLPAHHGFLLSNMAWRRSPVWLLKHCTSFACDVIMLQLKENLDAKICGVLANIYTSSRIFQFTAGSCYSTHLLRAFSRIVCDRNMDGYLCWPYTHVLYGHILSLIHTEHLVPLCHRLAFCGLRRHRCCLQPGWTLYQMVIMIKAVCTKILGRLALGLNGQCACSIRLVEHFFLDISPLERMSFWYKSCTILKKKPVSHLCTEVGQFFRFTWLYKSQPPRLLAFKIPQTDIKPWINSFI